MRRTYLVTVGYNACRISEVTVRAADEIRACRRAIEIADADGDGWHPTDAVSDSFVERVEVDGESVAVPAHFTELGVLAPEFHVIWQGLQQVAAIAEEQSTDAATIERMRSAARETLWKAWLMRGRA